MKHKYIGLAMGALVAAGAFLSMPSCAHDQKVVSLAILPTTSTFTSPAFPPPVVNPTQTYVATATYIHPPATKDVTDQVTWAIDNDVATMVAPGVFQATLPPAGSKPNTPGPCGIADITATIPEGTGGSSNIVTAVASITVNNEADQLCPDGGMIGSLAVGVFGTGSVSSLPAGINVCAQSSGVCIATFDVGASVLLTASSIPTSWQNCPGAAGTNTCVITIPTGGTAVSVTF